MIKKNITKFVVAVALTLAVTLGSGIAADQIGLDITAPVYAGDTCGAGSGGGC